MNTAELGLELAKARRKAGLGQAELAGKIGTTQSAISRAEAGWVLPTIDFVERVAVATRQPIQAGSILIIPLQGSGSEASARLERIRGALGEYAFDPWVRDPSPAEQKALIADGLTHEYFESKRTPTRRRK